MIEEPYSANQTETNKTNIDRSFSKSCNFSSKQFIFDLSAHISNPYRQTDDC